MAVVADDVIIKRREQERAELAAPLARVVEHSLLDDLVGDEALEQVVGVVRRDAAVLDQVRPQRRQIALEQRRQRGGGGVGIAAMTRLLDERPLRVGERRGRLRIVVVG